MKTIIKSGMLLVAALTAGSAFAFSSSLDFETTLQPGQTFNYPLERLYENTVYNMICTFDLDQAGTGDDVSAAQITRRDDMGMAPGDAPEFSVSGQRYGTLMSGTSITFPINSRVATEVNHIVKGEEFSVRSLDYTANLIVRCTAYPVQ